MTTSQPPSSQPPVESSPPSINISIEAAPCINYAMQLNDVPAVRSIRIENTGSSSLRDLQVTVSASRPVFSPLQFRMDSLEAGAAHKFEPVDLVFDLQTLCNQAERERLQLIVEITAGGVPVARAAHQFDLLAFNEWHGAGGLADLIAAFVTPNHPSVEALLAETRDVLGTMTGDPALSGYQSNNPDRVRATVEAAARAFRAREIGYVNPPASFEQTGQKVRSVDQVLDGRLGTCLDLVVALASVLEQIGLNTLVLLHKGHATLGVWLRDDRLPQTMIDDRTRIAKRVQLREILVIETTALVAGATTDFRAAQSLAAARLETDDFAYAVDVAACRKDRLRPLPSRLVAGGVFQVVQQPAQASPTLAEPPVILTEVRGPAPERARPAAEPDGLPPDAAARLSNWKRKLLDLSLRNRLLNYREGKRGVPLLIPDLAEFEDRLSEGGAFAIQPKTESLQGLRDMGAEARRTGADAEAEILRARIAEGTLCSPLGSAELGSRLLQLFREARTSVEESGSSTLYLALGSLVWYESASSEVGHVAPLVLVPVALQRNSTGRAFTLARVDEEPKANVTLLEKLRTDFGLDGRHLERLDQDESGYDIRAAFDGFVDLVKDVPRWEIRRDAALSQFSFAKFVMWSDLELRAPQIASSKVVRRLIDRSGSVPLSEVEPVEEPDRPSPPGGILPAVDADSSQLAAVHNAMRGRSFVLQGPPGTGKSQTITNILVSAIASGKRVLFVAEKMAALSVVQSRLQRLGLAPYCLELHSSKAGKKAVLDQLQQALEAAAEIEPGEWDPRVQELERARTQLNEYVRALHAPRASGDTVYRVLGRHARFSSAPKVALPISSPLGTTRDRLAGLRAAVDRMAKAAATVGNPATHPLRGIGHTHWHPGLESELAQGGRRLARAASELAAAARAALTAIAPALADAQPRMSRSELVWLSDVCSLLLERRAPTAALLQDPDWGAVRPMLLEEVRLGRRHDAIMADLGSAYRETLLAANLDDLLARAQAAASAGWPLKWFKIRGVRTALRAFARDARHSSADPVADITRAREAAAALGRVSGARSVGQRLVGTRWGPGCDWDEAERLIDWAGRLRALLASRPDSPRLDDRVAASLVSLASTDADRLAEGSRARKSFEALRAATATLRDTCSELDQTLSLRLEEIAIDDQPGFLDAIAGAAERWAGAADALGDWCSWRQEQAAEGLPELVPLASAIGTGEVAPSVAKAAFESAFAAAWLAEAYKLDPALGGFSLARHDQAVQTFRGADSAVVGMGAAVARARRQQAAPVPAATHANPESELGILRRQLALKARHMPVRKLVEKLPTLIPRLKPCWLMSPMSVAQYLDPKLPPFDLVVFDEASQIPPWDAVGALARGAEAVIVGDSKQLPPTNFFAKLESGEADDESDFDELESVLDEAVASRLPTMSLLWHYRSRHESLIAFSNHHYYGNRLLTFPSPEASIPGLGVSMRYLADGRYDKSASRTNKVEARAVVDEVVRRLRAAGDGPASLGVVTFSVAQQYLIEDLLDAERQRHPEIERFFASGADEPVFIKNLENVQGDERDVILFSVCYGPAADGSVSMNFGPINRGGGERRLNVAITRARREVVVFSSLRPDQIDLSRTRATGAAHLRSFLDYAQRGPRAILEAVSVGEAPESPFEEAVRDALVARGHLVDVQVGCSGYRIDLAVKDPSSPGRYLLGIECDGAAYHSAKSARDRDRLREQVLRGLGWKIHRVWSTDWFRSPKACLERIEKAIRAASAEKDAVPVASERATPVERPKPADPVAPMRFASLAVAPAPAETQAATPTIQPVRNLLPGAKPCTFATLPEADRDPDALRAGECAAALARDVRAIVEVESPVHMDRLAGAIAEAWGIERMSSRVRDALDDAVRRAEGYGWVTRDGDFLWSGRAGEPELEHFRVPAEDGTGQRRVEHIHPAEIALAVRAVLEQQFSMPLPVLCTEVARVFGLQRAGSRAEAGIRASVDRLAARGGCRVQGDTVSLAG